MFVCRSGKGERRGERGELRVEYGVWGIVFY